MEKMVTATFMVRGTEKEIGRIVAKIASLSTCKEVVSLYIKGGLKTKKEYDAEAHSAKYPFM